MEGYNLLPSSKPKNFLHIVGGILKELIFIVLAEGTGIARITGTGVNIEIGKIEKALESVNDNKYPKVGNHHFSK